ncbi:UMP kinase [Salinispira pacifica]
MLKVISLGGSIVAPQDVDVPFVRQLSKLVRTYLEANAERRLIFVVGGGGPARAYQRAYREIAGDGVESEQDWIGIAATRLNGQLVKAIFQDLCDDPVVTDPTASIEFSGRILVAAGWKPGFSTDYDAVLLAKRFGADAVINLSNIEKVFTSDPRKNPDARPLDRVTWSDFRKLVGDRWNPGANHPFDPVATRKAAELQLRVIVAAGKNLPNLEAILEERDFTGTQIGPE